MEKKETRARGDNPTHLINNEKVQMITMNLSMNK